MDKSDERSLTPTKPQSLSTAAASLAGRGLRDLQKATSKPQPKVQVDTLKMLPALAKVMDVAFRMGYYSFKENARFVLAQIRQMYGDEAADSINLDSIQGFYIGMSGKFKDKGADSKLVVIDIESLDEIIQEDEDNPLDMEFLTAGITLAGYHIEAGTRAFKDYTQIMLKELGEAARPYLWSWYETVRHYPGLDTTGMTPPEEVIRLLVEQERSSQGIDEETK
jgi:hypothetical protein